jgi:hypothetical protein
MQEIRRMVREIREYRKCMRGVWQIKEFTKEEERQASSLLLR